MPRLGRQAGSGAERSIGAERQGNDALSQAHPGRADGALSGEQIGLSTRMLSCGLGPEIGQGCTTSVGTGIDQARPDGEVRPVATHPPAGTVSQGGRGGPPSILRAFDL